MEVVFNQSNYFFDIDCPDLKGDTKVSHLVNQDVISFSVCEEMNKITTGSLVLKDESQMYSRIFRPGMRFNISWGYKNWNPASLGFGEVLSPVSYRKGIQCVISSPSGSGNESGDIEYSVNFFSIDFLNPRIEKVFEKMSYGDAVSNVMDDMGVVIKIIDFDIMNQSIDSRSSLRQHESDFNFLQNQAKEWHCSFHIGYTPAQAKVGLFIQDKKMDSENAKSFLKYCTGADIPAKDFYYKSKDKSNVSSYTWQNHVGESGQGDSVQLYLVGGQMQFQHYIAETQKVVTYRINEQKIKARIEKADDKTKAIMSTNFLGASDFNDVKWAFDEIQETTAPQGVGFTFNMNMIGDPMLVPGMRANFIDGFPSPVIKKDPATDVIIFWIRKGVHNMNKTNYTTNLEIVDSYTLNGSLLNDSGLRI